MLLIENEMPVCKAASMVRRTHSVYGTSFIIG
jgi:hypothetical protein